MEKSSSSSLSKDGDSAINSNSTNNANTMDLESGKSRSSPSHAAGVNEEQHSYGQSTYQDKDDDTFLDEVENTLLGSDSLNGNGDSPGHHGSGIKANTSRSSTAVNSPRRASSPRHPHYPHFFPDSTSQDDPSAFRRKCRAGIFYLICSTAHELVIYKLAQRTSWPIATSFIPFEFLVFTIITGIASLYMKKTSNLKMQHLLGLNGLPILPCLAWKESAPLAALTVAAAAFRVLKDASLEASISSAVSVSCFARSSTSTFCPHQLAMLGTCSAVTDRHAMLVPPSLPLQIGRKRLLPCEMENRPTSHHHSSYYYQSSISHPNYYPKMVS